MQCYLFQATSKKNENHSRLLATVPILDFWGPTTVLPAGGGGMKGWMKFVRVSLMFHFESRSWKALEKQYLSRGSVYTFNSAPPPPPNSTDWS